MHNYDSDINKMFNKLKNEIIKQSQTEAKETIEHLTEENANLKEANIVLSRAAEKVAIADSTFELFNFLMQVLKSKLDGCANKADQELLVYNFLDCFFERDFKENTYEVPLWLGCGAQYYSNRIEVFRVLRALDFQLPEGIENFRLPQDWTEEELDEFFAHMGNHINCNGGHFQDNLRYWKPNALDDPMKVCSRTFSEVPWQFLLRNPLLKKEKYLVEIGRMFCVPKGKYHAYQWYHFAKILEYQDLTPEEIKIIIDNIDYTYFNKTKDEGLNKFLLKNIELIDNEVFLDVLYRCFYDSYTFKSQNILLKMPYRYIKQYLKDVKDIEWLKRHRDKFTQEQRVELTFAVLCEDNE